MKISQPASPLRREQVQGAGERAIQQRAFRGNLFSDDFLLESIRQFPDWALLRDTVVEDLGTNLRHAFDQFPTDQTPNESQTEDDLIWPILECLGWTASLRQQNLAP